jgi:hypothetical protein
VAAPSRKARNAYVGVRTYDFDEDLGEEFDENEKPAPEHFGVCGKEKRDQIFGKGLLNKNPHTETKAIYWKPEESVCSTLQRSDRNKKGSK